MSTRLVLGIFVGVVLLAAVFLAGGQFALATSQQPGFMMQGGNMAGMMSMMNAMNSPQGQKMMQACTDP